ncbi:hypothetical protein Ddye_023001 [Dipteronia dyeriana]|uniref:Uncharacterized protein n=1 Tax=Dipteronia dyeriana TaxID=168575 RepID=A0AAD9WSU4_9ROSI|nr:hypothetical protein Ddye_023001 [Dipteronia dyeriana]
METSSEEQTKPPEIVTGNAAPASIDGDGASSLSCAVTAAVTTKAKRTKAINALQILTCAIRTEEIRQEFLDSKEGHVADGGG